MLNQLRHEGKRVCGDVIWTSMINCGIFNTQIQCGRINQLRLLSRLYTTIIFSITNEKWGNHQKYKTNHRCFNFEESYWHAAKPISQEVVCQKQNIFHGWKTDKMREMCKSKLFSSTNDNLRIIGYSIQQYFKGANYSLYIGF